MKNKFGKLNKSIYGLVQDARQFYREISDFLTNILHFTKSLFDPCLFKNNSNSLFLGLFVDDILLVGEKKDIDYFYKNIQLKFIITFDENIETFIGCHLNFKDN